MAKYKFISKVEARREQRSKGSVGKFLDERLSDGFVTKVRFRGLLDLTFNHSLAKL
jgi:hypothetical protein